MRLNEVTPELICFFKFDSNGLLPAIIQDDSSGEVLMLAYMNRESLTKTLATGETWFFSRSRGGLWHKGETSGHFQQVQAIFYDCDRDTLLLKVTQLGVACHEGERSCFHYRLTQEGTGEQIPGGPAGETPGGQKLARVTGEVFSVIRRRQAERPEGSYTSYLFSKGQDKILKKVGEEASEVIIGSKNNSLSEVAYETADLWYHLLVLLAYHGLTPDAIAEELARRR